MALIGTLVALPLAAASIGIAVLQDSNGKKNSYYDDDYESEEESEEEESEESSCDEDSVESFYDSVNENESEEKQLYSNEVEKKQFLRANSNASNLNTSVSSVVSPYLTSFATKQPSKKQLQGSFSTELETFDWVADTDNNTPNVDYAQVPVFLDTITQENSKPVRTIFKHQRGARGQLNLPTHFNDAVYAEQRALRSMAGGNMDGQNTPMIGNTLQDPTKLGYHSFDYAYQPYLPYSASSDLDQYNQQIPEASNQTSIASARTNPTLLSMPIIKNESQAINPTTNISKAYASPTLMPEYSIANPTQLSTSLLNAGNSLSSTDYESNAPVGMSSQSNPSSIATAEWTTITDLTDRSAALNQNAPTYETDVLNTEMAQTITTADSAFRYMDDSALPVSVSMQGYGSSSAVDATVNPSENNLNFYNNTVEVTGTGIQGTSTNIASQASSNTSQTGRNQIVNIDTNMGYDLANYQLADQVFATENSNVTNSLTLENRPSVTDKFQTITFDGTGTDFTDIRE